MISTAVCLCGRVSQFRFKKSFASKRNLAKQKQFRFVSLQFRETTKKVSLRKFRFGSFALKKFRCKLCAYNFFFSITMTGIEKNTTQSKFTALYILAD